MEPVTWCAKHTSYHWRHQGLCFSGLGMIGCLQPFSVLRNGRACLFQLLDSFLPALDPLKRLKCLCKNLSQVLDGALNDLLQHPDWEEWRSDLARVSFRTGELETFMESHKRYKQRPVSPATATEAAASASAEAPAQSEQRQGQDA